MGDQRTKKNFQDYGYRVKTTKDEDERNAKNKMQLVFT